MGSYDFLSDGIDTVQIKLYDCEMDRYNLGDKVPEGYGKDYTIVLPRWEPVDFALIKDGKFLKFTDNKNETYPPYISKWGETLEGPCLKDNVFDKIIRETKGEVSK